MNPLVVSQSLRYFHSHAYILCVSFLELLDGGTAVEHDYLQMCASVHVLKEQDICESFSEQAC